MRARSRLLAQGLALAALYALAVALGGALLVAGFQFGVLAGLSIMFYRGLALIAGIFVLLLGGLALALARRPLAGLAPRDAIAAATLSLALNIVFLTVVPVTVDRSISIFMLARMAADPQARVTPQDMAATFVRVYVAEDRQIARRLDEQAISGNVEKIGDAYRITPRGQAVIAAARLVARLFDSRSGLIAPPSSATTRGPPAHSASN